MNTGGSNLTKINNDASYQLNVSDGWIYYQNGSDGSKLYKIKIDGTERTKVVDDSTASINVIVDWIYYQNMDGTVLYRVKTDGTSRGIFGEGIPEQRGSSQGNSLNGGLAAQSGDWIYFKNSVDGSKLYKYNEESKEKIKISDDIPAYINILDGWVYYRNESDGGKLYKIKTDGTGKTQLNSDSSGFVSVISDWIYYQNGSDGGKAYKIKTDGTGRTKLNDMQSFHLTSVNGWIYFCNYPGNFNFYKMRTDGTGLTNLKHSLSWYMNIVDDWMYFRNEHDGNKIYKAKIDGSQLTKLNEDASYEINVCDGWIYYQNGSDGRKLYKMRIDGTERTKLSHDTNWGTNVIGDWIYYSNPGDGNKTYRIKNDGSAKELFGRDEQLVGYWNFDEDTLKDYGSGGNNGTVYGGPKRAAGVKGYAYSFDGKDDYVWLGDWFNFQQFTISMWVKPSNNQNSQWTDILDNYHDGTTNWVIQNDKSVDVMKYGFFDVGGIKLESSKFQHVVWVKDTTHSKIYIDGKVVYDGASKPIIYPGNQKLYIANWGRQKNRFWNGQMDELRIYNYGLNDAEIQDLYNDANSGEDLMPPEWNDGSSITVTAKGADTFTVNWPAADDNRGVSNYRIKLDGEVIATVQSDVLTYKITGLDQGKEYSITIDAEDSSGNWSLKSLSAAAEIADSTNPYWEPTSIFKAQNIGSKMLQLSWSGAKDNVGILSYRVWNNGELIASGLPADTSTYNVTGLTPATEYNFDIDACDAAGNYSDAKSLNVTTIAESSLKNLIAHSKIIGLGDVKSELVLSDGDEQTLELRVEEKPRITGTMLDGETGNVLPEKLGKLYLVNSDGSRVFSRNVIGGENGEFKVNVDPGQYVLDFTDLGYRQKYNVKAETGKIVEMGQLSLYKRKGLFLCTLCNSIGLTPNYTVAGGIVSVRGVYQNKVTDEGNSKAEEALLRIFIPEGTQLVQGSILVDGKIPQANVNGQYYEINMGTIEAGQSGNVRYQLKVNDSAQPSKLNVELRMKYRIGNDQYEDRIGSAIMGIEDIKVFAPRYADKLNQISAVVNIGSGDISSQPVPVTYDPDSVNTIDEVSIKQYGHGGRPVTIKPSEGVAKFPYAAYPYSPFYVTVKYKHPDH